MFLSLTPKKILQIKTNDLLPGFTITETVQEKTTNRNGNNMTANHAICLGKRM